MRIWAFFLLLGPLSASALSVGALTYHLAQGAGHKYAGKLDSSGELIANPMLGYDFADSVSLMGRYYSRTTGFVGANSIGEPMMGAVYQIGAYKGPFELGFASGAYVQDCRPWAARGVQEFALVRIQNTDIVPIVGLALSYNIGSHRINGLITPILVNISVDI